MVGEELMKERFWGLYGEESSDGEDFYWLHGKEIWC
jgi:hypothetical protein